MDLLVVGVIGAINNFINAVKDLAVSGAVVDGENIGVVHGVSLSVSVLAGQTGSQTCKICESGQQCLSTALVIS
jgi:hypothetical protein